MTRSRSEQLKAWEIHKAISTSGDKFEAQPQVGDAVEVLTLSAGANSPSSTRLLADRATVKVLESFAQRGVGARSSTLELAALAVDVVGALTGGPYSERLRQAVASIARADVLVVGTPIYKAGISGLFKSFVDLLENDLLVGKLVLLTATAGSPRHAMVVDDHLRPLFAFMRTMPVPTAVCATPEDWSDPGLTKRLERAALEVTVLHGRTFEKQIRHRARDAYNHEFGSVARADLPTDALDFDTPLMRLATGGVAPDAR